MADLKSRNCLFVTWDGPQTSYLTGLYLPIFRGLASHGYRFHVLQFTWGSPENIAQINAECVKSGIPYRSVRVNRSLGGAGPFFSALRGSREVGRCIRDWSIDILMPRSIMPALAVRAIPARLETRLVYDCDGLALDERADFGSLSRSSLRYRLLRRVETRMLRIADRVLVRTAATIPILIQRAGVGVDPGKFFVTSNGRDVTPYLGSAARSETSLMASGHDDAVVLCFAGSVGPQYRVDWMLQIARQLRRHFPSLVFRVFTGDSRGFGVTLAQQGLDDCSWVELRHCPPSAMPAALMECDAALAFRAPSLSTTAVAPLKIGEYLLAGLPIIGNGHFEHASALAKAGVLHDIDSPDAESVAAFLHSCLAGDRVALRARCREMGVRYFSLERSVSEFAAALEVA